MFTADWLDVIFVHFCVDAERLARCVPLELDRFEGDALVSLVAFTQSNLRPTWGGRIGRMLVAPLAHHEFLNVRTYVRHGDANGIFFMTEWIPNRLAAFVGPRTYGLPYRLGRLEYNGMRRDVKAEGRRLAIEASPAERAAPDVLTEFLLERYTAFTHRNDVLRRFDVEHAPWPHRRVEVELRDVGLLRKSGNWLDGAELVAAHYSPGVRDVVIGRPVVVQERGGLLRSLRRRSRG